MTGDTREKWGRYRYNKNHGVFITERYIEKVAGKGAGGSKDNCKYEFEYSVEILGPEKLVPVVMEHRAANTGEWIGPVKRSVGTTLYTAFWNDDTDERYLECAKRIVDEIMQRINHKPIKELLRERMDMIIAKKTGLNASQDELVSPIQGWDLLRMQQMNGRNGLLH